MPDDSDARPGLSPRYSDFSCLPARLKDWRQLRGIKASNAAAELGVAASTWNHWESGRRFPSGQMLVHLIAHTGISLKEIVCENAHVCPFRPMVGRGGPAAPTCPPDGGVNEGSLVGEGKARFIRPSSSPQATGPVTAGPADQPYPVGRGGPAAPTCPPDGGVKIRRTRYSK